MKKRLSLAFKTLVSLGLLYYLFQKTNFHLLWQTFKKISPFYFVWALLFWSFFQGASIIRWWVLTRYLGLNFSLGYLARVYLIGVYFNTFLPGLLGGDLVRVFYLVSKGATKTKASFSVLYDRGFGLLGAIILLGLFLQERYFLPPLAQKSLFWFCVFSLLAIILLTLALRFLREKISHELFQTASQVTGFSPFFSLLFWGIMVQVFYTFHFMFLAKSLGVDIPWAKYFLIVPLTGILASLPISLGGFGVREGTISYLLGFFGYPLETGIALGFLLYGVNLLGGFLGLFFYLSKRDGS